MRDGVVAGGSGARGAAAATRGRVKHGTVPRGRVLAVVGSRARGRVEHGDGAEDGVEGSKLTGSQNNGDANAEEPDSADRGGGGEYPWSPVIDRGVGGENTRIGASTEVVKSRAGAA